MLAKHYQCTPLWVLSQPILSLPRLISYINTST
nr:MAG TPA: hypothetical protein [Caudoviricetes sp.]DAK31800.1 MAG TPA: hypothetical protein [Caudoviricetes sp.]